MMLLNISITEGEISNKQFARQDFSLTLHRLLVNLTTFPESRQILQHFQVFQTSL